MAFEMGTGLEPAATTTIKTMMTMEEEEKKCVHKKTLKGNEDSELKPD